MSEQPWLVADVGATNARFSRAGPDGLEGDAVRFPTAAFASADELLDQALAELAAGVPAAVGLAVAGPVTAGVGRLTNGSLEFDADRLSRRRGFPVTVVNDFHAVARALPDLECLRAVGGGAPEAATKAVLGPGSGLGMGILVPSGDGWRVLASEGGHADLAPGSPLESEILLALQMAHGHVSWETVLSGPGLVRLYRAVAGVWGAAPEALDPETISARGVGAEDPVCHQTLEVFFGLLGAAAGNLAVTVCAWGGIYVAGGIVPGLADFAAQSPMRRRFDERGAMSGRFRDVPLYLVLDPAPGLLGALGCLRDAAQRDAAQR